jgi:hypothetical protein
MGHSNIILWDKITTQEVQVPDTTQVLNSTTRMESQAVWVLRLVLNSVTLRLRQLS